MNERVLIISGDVSWREALLIALESAGFEAAPGDASTRWLELARAFKSTSAVIHAERPGSQTQTGFGVEEIGTVIDELRAVFPLVPVVILTAVPDERLRKFSSGYGATDVLFDLDGDPAAIVRLIQGALLRLKSIEPSQPPSPYATIEVTLGEAHLICEARAGVTIENFGPEAWDRRDLARMNDNFRSSESDDALFTQLVNRRSLDDASRTLLWHAFERPLALGREFCEKHSPGSKICCRFTVNDGDLEFVPFELVASANEGEYLRSVQPLARRLTVKQLHNNPDAPRQERKPGAARVLFILSDASGSLSVVNHYFKGQEAISLAKLSHIYAEHKEIITYHGSQNVRSVILKPGEDAFVRLDEVFKECLYDIIHFAGHSVRSDTNNDVFLVLPGMHEKSVIGYNAENFARRVAEANARLVVLSSCEGASCKTLARMAALGIPAVVGFRWKIDDRDAAIFTPALHRALGKDLNSVPVVQAFHKALQELKDPAQERLSWFSPVLMLQRTIWHDYTAGE